MTVEVPEERPPKPFDNKFCQQKMTHVYSQVSPQAVILCLFVIAVVFIPVGAATIIASDAIFESVIRYDNVHNCTRENNQGLFTYTSGNGSVSQGCRTNVNFTLDKTLTPPIYIYYKLKKFNQNYRMYAKSFSELQLSGRDFVESDLEDCDPWKKAGNRLYLPCGAVPWSMFNDTISLYRLISASDSTLVTKTTMPSTAEPMCRGDWFSRVTNEPLNANNTKCVKKGIAFDEDINERFTSTRTTDDKVLTGTAKSGETTDFSANGWYEGEPGHQIPIVTDEDLMVWTRIAPLSDFYKLYRKITTTLPNGQYVWSIDERFDAASSGAEKWVVLATVSWVGGKNHVLGALYLTMGSISLVLAFGFIGMYIARNKE